MTCHNSRRGLRNDSTFDDYYGTSAAAQAPHGSAQADVVMGENAYLVEVGIRGNHSTVEDSCAACHMVETPPPADLSYDQGGTNHTFYASIDVCSSCHGPSVSGETIQATTNILLEDLQAAIEQGLYDLIAEQTGLGRIIDLDGDAQITDPSEIVDIVFGESRGQQAMTVTFAGDVTMGPYAMTAVDVLQPDDPNPPVVVGQLYDVAAPELVKAGWNYWLIENDGSGGVHNPSYAFGVLVAGIQALDPAGAAAILPPSWVDPVYLPAGADGTR
jgi:mono/diheme cytochrome c family protein